MSPSLLQIMILGLVQGATELLPVSSSAHVIAAERVMHLDPSSPEMTFLLAMLHAGTMVAMIAYFWRSWRESFFSSAAQFASAAGRLVLATGVTAGVYLALELLIKRTLLRDRPGADLEELFSNLPLVALALVVGGVLILVTGLRFGSVDTTAAGPGAAGRSVSGGAAFAIGLAQGVCLPFRGLSRSGSTISTGMLVGVPRRVCEEFSFALGVILTPPVIVRELHRFYKVRAAEHAAVDVAALLMPGLLGMVLSFGAGLLALRWLSGWLEKGHWHYFGIYCFAAAAGIYALARMGY
jgi:undecaprenyl-diphosphatase